MLFYLVLTFSLFSGQIHTLIASAYASEKDCVVAMLSDSNRIQAKKAVKSWRIECLDSDGISKRLKR